MSDKEENLKVSDLVDFREQDYNLALAEMKSLDELCAEYSTLTKGQKIPDELEALKGKFVSHMSTLTDIYSKVKAFKGSNHTFLEDARKQFKAEAIIRLRDEGVRATEANNIVYASEYYKKRVRLMEKLKNFFINVDEKHDFYTNVLSYLSQTISIVSKDYEFNRYSKS